MLFLLISCENIYTFWDISQFNIVEDALKDSEEIKIIYTSRGPDFNENLEYYYRRVITCT